MKEKSHEQRCTRREFLHLMSSGGISALALLSIGYNSFAELAGSTVSVTTSSLANDSLGTSSKSSISSLFLARRKEAVKASASVNTDVLKEMLASLITRSSNEKDERDGWRKILRCERDDVIGLKINTLGGRTIATHRELVMVIIDSLTRAGIQPDHIVVWDRRDDELRRAGYSLADSPASVRCYGTLPRKGYDDKRIINLGDKQIRFSRIITEDVSILINIPILKTHALAGISGALKNNYGTFDTPHLFHSNLCNPWCAELNTFPEIKEKSRFVIVDALQPLCNGGPDDSPRYRWNYGAVYAGTDPVATDAFGLTILEERRRQEQLPSIVENAQKPEYIFTAEKLGLGNAQREKYIVHRV